MEGHVALGCIEDEELRPDQPQQCYLVGDLELREAWYVPRPLHGTEEETRCKLADIVDAHHVVGSQLHLAVS